MSITRFDPFRDFVSLREAMDRLLEDSVIRPATLITNGQQGTSFPVDLYETADGYVLKATLPGVAPDALDINATTDGVSIKAEVKPDAGVREESWLLRERRYGTFQRHFGLPMEIDPNKVEASFDNGVLTLTLPKAETVKPKQVKVKTGTPIEARAR
ncbi:MAG TPA: Hsp20/alpha crystallin family protein [Candidatus Dormibacteraeota bacterium]|jgi:HSP20 family protein|nr:Hsp20/alpha crystallin family protein [Candidatus Dormibacteraeota bacterium]